MLYYIQWCLVLVHCILLSDVTMVFFSHNFSWLSRNTMYSCSNDKIRLNLFLSLSSEHLVCIIALMDCSVLLQVNLFFLPLLSVFFVILLVILWSLSLSLSLQIINLWSNHLMTDHSHYWTVRSRTSCTMISFFYMFDTVKMPVKILTACFLPAWCPLVSQ